ncbi:MAG: metal ABC transporter ATP-binding protein [Oscillospiraceae bacterium]|jgi:zinc transport system ATP-binding protein|nr:metal ABC transporter ATP-binding protein [Oscillospiraceae bacterium]
MPQLSCRDVSLGYDGKTIVSGLTFDVNKGDYLCIVGDNGSGKSTLMKTILRLQTPLSGKIETGDGVAPNEIGYLLQQTAAQKDFPATVLEVVLSGLLNRAGMRPFYSKTEKQTANENMETLGISHIAKKCYRELSGGQQQRVLLARALCATRKIILMDEPAAGLDPGASIEMYTLIKNLNDSGVTVIMISHDIIASVKYASHILHIGREKTLFFGTTEDYLKTDIGKLYTHTGGDTV